MYNLIPETGLLKTRLNDLATGSSRNNWECLSEVTTKADYLTPKISLVVATDVLKATTDSFHIVSTLHRRLIPKDNMSSLN